MYLTNMPYGDSEQRTQYRSEKARTCGPTTLARTLKFLMVSIPTGIFSSGHFRCNYMSARTGSSNAYALTLSRVRELLSSTNEPMSFAISSLTLSIAFWSESCVVAEMCRYKGGSLSVALVRSGYHVPFVLTEAPVSSWIYRIWG